MVASGLLEQFCDFMFLWGEHPEWSGGKFSSAFSVPTDVTVSRKEETFGFIVRLREGVQYLFEHCVAGQRGPVFFLCQRSRTGSFARGKRQFSRGVAMLFCETGII